LQKFNQSISISIAKEFATKDCASIDINKEFATRNCASINIDKKSTIKD